MHEAAEATEAEAAEAEAAEGIKPEGEWDGEGGGSAITGNSRYGHQEDAFV